MIPESVSVPETFLPSLPPIFAVRHQLPAKSAEPEAQIIEAKCQQIFAGVDALDVVPYFGPLEVKYAPQCESEEGCPKHGRDQRGFRQHALTEIYRVQRSSFQRRTLFGCLVLLLRCPGHLFQNGLALGQEFCSIRGDRWGTPILRGNSRGVGDIFIQ